MVISVTARCLWQGQQMPTWKQSNSPSAMMDSKRIAHVKKKREKKDLHVLALFEIWVLPSLILQFWGKLSITMWLLLNFGFRNSNPWKEKDANIGTHPENKAAPLIKSNLQSVSSAPAVWIAWYSSHSSPLFDCLLRFSASLGALLSDLFKSRLQSSFPSPCLTSSSGISSVPWLNPLRKGN